MNLLQLIIRSARPAPDRGYSITTAANGAYLSIRQQRERRARKAARKAARLARRITRRNRR